MRLPLARSIDLARGAIVAPVGSLLRLPVAAILDALRTIFAALFDPAGLAIVLAVFLPVALAFLPAIVALGIVAAITAVATIATLLLLGSGGFGGVRWNGTRRHGNGQGCQPARLEKIGYLHSGVPVSLVRQSKSRSPDGGDPMKRVLCESV